MTQTVTVERKQLEQWLEALEELNATKSYWWQEVDDQTHKKLDNSITAIKEALAQPEQPKVRTGDCLLVGVCASEGHKIQPKEPQRKPLTDEEITAGWRTLPIRAPMSWSAYLAGARMAEAAHGIKE